MHVVEVAQDARTRQRSKSDSSRLELEVNVLQSLIGFAVVHA